MNVYKQLETVVLPKMTDYQTDLIKHDKEWIKANPGVPFLHYSSNTGTHIIPFTKRDDYPAKGVKVPYLFGEADREHMLKEKVEIAKYFNKERYYAKWVHYFNGKELLEISHGFAIELATAYTIGVKNGWKQDDILFR